MTTPTGITNEAIDPICGMTVDTQEAVSSERGGKHYYFCCPGCKAKFDAGEPAAVKSPTAVPTGSLLSAAGDTV